MTAPKIRIDGLFLLVLAALALLWWISKNSQLFNPASDQNLAYSGTNAVGQVLSQDDHWNFGVALWEVFNPETVAAENTALGSPENIDTAEQGGSAFLNWLAGGAV